MTDKILEVRGLTKTYGGVKKRGAKKADPTLDVLKGIDLDIYRGDVVCLIGPSGCGKSTFLRCLNRLETPTSGSIKFEGVEVNETHIDAVRQKMGMVFQHFNLFPHLTVKKNLELAPSLLKLRGHLCPCRRAAGPRRSGRQGQRLPQEPVRRSAAAHCHRPRAGNGPGCDPVRRAHQRP